MIKIRQNKDFLLVNLSLRAKTLSDLVKAEDFMIKHLIKMILISKMLWMKLIRTIVKRRLVFCNNPNSSKIGLSPKISRLNKKFNG